MRRPTEDDLTLKESGLTNCASRWDPVQHHLETLAIRLKEPIIWLEITIGREKHRDYYNRETKLVTFEPDLV